MKLLKLLSKLVIIIFLLLASSDYIYSQKAANPIQPGGEADKKFIGLFFGGGYNYSGGSFLVSCPTCIFEKPMDYGLRFGSLYEQEFATGLRFGVQFAYDFISLYSSFREKETIEFTSPSIDTLHYKTAINFRNIGEASFNLLSAIPYLKYSYEPLFIRFGFGLSYVVSGKVKHTKELLDKSALLPTGEFVSVTLKDYKGTQKVLEEADFPKINSIQLSLNPAIGLNLKLGDKISFSPVFEYYLPLSNISENGTDLKVNSWRFIGELRIFINKKEIKSN